MPKIAQYTQQTTPQSAGMARGYSTPEVSAGSGLSDFGSAGIAVADRMQRQSEIDAERQRIEDEKRQRAQEKIQLDDAKVESAKVLSDARLQWTEQLLKAKESAAPGASGLTPQLLSQFDEYSKKVLSERPNAHTQKILAEGLQNLRTHIGQDALQFESNARVDNRINTLEAGINKTAQAVLAMPGQRSTALAEQLSMIDGMEIPPKQKEALKERALQTIDSAGLNGEIGAARNSTKALDGLLERMNKGEFPGVPAQHLAAAEARIGNFKNTLIVKAEAAERRKLAGLEQQERRLSWYVENGRDIPPAEFDRFTKESRGTPFESAAQGLVVEQKAVSALTLLPPDAMLAKVKDIEAGFGPNPTKEQIVHVEKLKRFADRSIKLLRESPLDFATQREGAVVTPLDLNKPDTWGETLGARVPILRETSQRTGVAPKGLLPQEAAALSNAIKSAPPQQQAEYLGKLRAGFGDDRVFKATMQQIAPDNPVIAAAGVASARGLESTFGRSVSELMLRGNALLRQDTHTDGKPSGGKLMPMPKDDLMDRLFATHEKDAFAGKEQARNGALQSAKAIYAAMSSDSGDYSGVLNTSRWDSAMKLATGGIEKHQGRSIVLPYGMAYGDFKDRLKAKTVEMVKAGTLAPGITPENLRGMPLENVGDGRYVLRVGDGTLIGKDGRPAILDLNP
jgi:hypothetical protein